jgi:hypothetical protein
MVAENSHMVDKYGKAHIMESFEMIENRHLVEKILDKAYINTVIWWEKVTK